MSKEALVLEVSESGFSRYVLENSHKLPVLVEFMDVASEPCAVMADILAGLALEFAGQFVFARVDVDEQPGLVKQYNIENLPSLLVFQNGEMSFAEQGQLTEDELRVLLRGLGIFNQADALREEARGKHMAGDTAEAIMLLSKAIQQEPGNTRVAMDMVQIFIDVGELEQAQGLFNRLPDTDKESSMGKSLVGQLTFADLAAKTVGIEALNERLAKDTNDHAARFDLSVCLVAGHDYDGAMEQLFSLLEMNPDYQDGAAREMIVTITNMLSPNNPEQASAYRRRLSSLLN
ncbi:MAG: tetratricopeptide repeat protein [Gammaproteobacteria bacterium]|nr:tetratricopeptide repeat protein [Gammaproteobacteria bacterium]